MALDPQREERFYAALESAGRFFMGDSPVHRAMRKLAQILDEAAIPYAIAGAMALNEHGVERATRDVDVLLTREGLAALKTPFRPHGRVTAGNSSGLNDGAATLLIGSGQGAADIGVQPMARVVST